MSMQRRAEETRTRILDAAGVCFAQHGYEATGVAEICRQASVTKGAFYHHFPSKQAAFLALLDQWLTDLDTRLLTTYADRLDVPEGILKIADAAQWVFQIADGHLPIFLEFLTQAHHDPAVWQATIAPYRRYQDFFARIAEAGVAEGTLRPYEPDMVARVMVSLAVGLLLQDVFDPDGADWGQVACSAFQMLLDGLKNKPT